MISQKGCIFLLLIVKQKIVHVYTVECTLVGIYIEFLLKTVGDQIEDLVPKKCQ